MTHSSLFLNLFQLHKDLTPLQKICSEAPLETAVSMDNKTSLTTNCKITEKLQVRGKKQEVGIFLLA